MDPTKQCVGIQYSQLKDFLARVGGNAAFASAPPPASPIAEASRSPGGSSPIRHTSTIKTILKLTADPAKNINVGPPARVPFAQMLREFKEIDDIIVNQDPVEVMLLYSKSLNNNDLMVLALRNAYGQEQSCCKALNVSFCRFMHNLSKVFPLVELLEAPTTAMIKAINFYHPEVQVFSPNTGKEFTLVSQSPSFKGVHLQLSRAIRSGVLDKLLRQTGSLCFPFEAKARLAAVNRFRVLCQPVRKKGPKPMEKRAETIGLNSKVFLDRAIKLVGDENLIISNRKKAFRSLVNVLYKGELELHEKSKKLIFVDVRTQKKYRSCPEAIKGGVLDKLLLQTGVIALKSSVFDVAYDRYRKITQASRQAKAGRTGSGSPVKALPPPVVPSKPTQVTTARSPYMMKATSRALNGCNNRIRGLPMGVEGSPSTNSLQSLLAAQGQYDLQNKISPDSRKGVAVPKNKLVTGVSSAKKNEGKHKPMSRYPKGVNKENSSSQQKVLFSPGVGVGVASYPSLNPTSHSTNSSSLNLNLNLGVGVGVGVNVNVNHTTNSATIKDVTNSVNLEKKPDCGGKRPRDGTDTLGAPNLKLNHRQDQNVNNANVSLSPNVTTTGSNNSGRWTNVEHARFLKGLSVFGEKYVCNAKFNWREMAQYVRTRDPVQVRTHAQKYFIKLNKQKEKKRKRGEYVESQSSSLESKISDLLLRINPRPLKKEKRESKAVKSPMKPVQSQSSNERLDRLTIADLQSAQQMLLLQSQPFAMQSVLQQAAN